MLKFILMVALVGCAQLDTDPTGPYVASSLAEITGDSRLEGAVLQSIRPCQYMQITAEENGSEHPTGRITEAGPATELMFKARATTLADVAALLESSINARLVGDYDPSVQLDEIDRFLVELYADTGCD